MVIQWRLKKFDELTPFELYAAIRLRNEVFVVEQNCVFQDADNKDQGCFHLLGFEKEELIAYTRLVPPAHIYKEPSIGRVVTSPGIRHAGAGRELMKKSIECVYDLFGKQTIKIGAQLYLKKFYESLGFIQTGSSYLEDDIEHIYMLKKYE